VKKAQEEDSMWIKKSVLGAAIGGCSIVGPTWADNLDGALSRATTNVAAAAPATEVAASPTDESERQALSAELREALARALQDARADRKEGEDR
jgi:hypothetical protein